MLDNRLPNDSHVGRVFPFPTDKLEDIMKAWNLPCAYLEFADWRVGNTGWYGSYSSTELAGSPGPEHIGKSGMKSYLPNICLYVPGFIMFICTIGFVLCPPEDSDGCHDIVFTYDANSRITQGLLRTNENDVYHRCISCLRDQWDVSRHPMAVLFASLEVSTIGLLSTMQLAQDSVVDLQKSVGLTRGFKCDDSRRPSSVTKSDQQIATDLCEACKLITVIIFFTTSAIERSNFTFEVLEYLEKPHPKPEAEMKMVFLKQKIRALESRLNHIKYNCEHLEALGKTVLQFVSLSTVAMQVVALANI